MSPSFTTDTRCASSSLTDSLVSSEKVEAGASLVIRNLTVKNDGWVPTPLTEAENSGGEDGLPEAIRIRGFRVDKKGTHTIRLAEGERWGFPLKCVFKGPSAKNELCGGTTLNASPQVTNNTVHVAARIAFVGRKSPAVSSGWVRSVRSHLLLKIPRQDANEQCDPTWLQIPFERRR